MKPSLHRFVVLSILWSSVCILAAAEIQRELRTVRDYGKAVMMFGVSAICASGRVTPTGLAVMPHDSHDNVQAFCAGTLYSMGQASIFIGAFLWGGSEALLYFFPPRGTRQYDIINDLSD